MTITQKKFRARDGLGNEGCSARIRFDKDLSQKSFICHFAQGRRLKTDPSSDAKKKLLEWQPPPQGEKNNNKIVPGLKAFCGPGHARKGWEGSGYG